MKKFEVIIRGRNFLIKKGDRLKKGGFSTTRLVEANDYSDAAGIAMDSLRAELKDMVMNDKSDPPVMNVEDVKEVFYFADTELQEDRFIWDKE